MARRTGPGPSGAAFGRCSTTASSRVSCGSWGSEVSTRGEGPNKDTETTFRYKFGVLMPGQIRYPTKIEVSFRDPHPADAVAVEPPGAEITHPYGLGALSVPYYDRRAAIRQKIEALGGRQTVQARDVFDLVHLLQRDGSNLEAFLAGGLGAGLLTTAYQRALEITFGEYEGQVIEFLEPEIRSRYHEPPVRDEMRLRVAGLIERVREVQGSA